MPGSSCTMVVQRGINGCSSSDNPRLKAGFEQTFAQSCGNEGLLTSIEDALPARPRVGASLTVGFTPVGSFAGTHKTVTCAFVGHWLVGSSDRLGIRNIRMIRLMSLLSEPGGAYCRADSMLKRGGRCRIRTCDFYRVRIALYR